MCHDENRRVQTSLCEAAWVHYQSMGGTSHQIGEGIRWRALGKKNAVGTLKSLKVFLIDNNSCFRCWGLQCILNMIYWCIGSPRADEGGLDIQQTRT